jgi:DNA invertase Pin-like site-specific DNA recombinase
MTGQRIGYKRVSTVDQNTMRQLDGVAVDEVFEDKASGKSTSQRPALDAMLKHVRKGDVVLCHSMDRMARNLDDLRGIVLGLTSRGVRVEFTKEGLSFTGEDNALSKLLLSVMGAFAEFERSLILERQREGIAIAKAAGRYKGRKPKLTVEEIQELCRRVANGEQKSMLARQFKISRETLYQYVRSEETVDVSTATDDNSGSVKAFSLPPQTLTAPLPKDRLTRMQRNVPSESGAGRYHIVR